MSKYEIVIKLCPMCETKFQTKFGHKKEKTCCSRQCGNIFFSRNRTEKEKLKIKNSLLRKFSAIEKSKGKYTFECRACKKTFISRTPNRKCCSRECLSNDKVFSNTISKIIKDRIESGNHIGWIKRSTNIPSYPEKFFMTVLDSRGMKYKFDLHVGKWWIDFAFEDKMIALEIDGSQHNREDRKLLDIEKDKYLESCGWKVHRIKWKSINTERGKNYITEEIKNFERIYQSVV